MMKLKNALSLVLSLVLMAQLCLPVGAVAAEPLVPLGPALGAPKAEPAQPTAGDGAIDINGAVTLDISGADGYIAITDTGYKIGNATEETPHTGPYILKGNAKATNARILTHTIPVKSHILVKPGRNTSPIEITLKDVDISLAGPDDCAFTIINGGVNLTLSGTNTLKSGGSEPGLWVGEGMSGCGSLTITGKSTDSLTATAGSPENSDSDGGAGIGGRPFQTGGIITIDGGMVNATGGIGGAGIGGGSGSGGYGGTTTINGGTVNATGGSGSVSGGANSVGGIGIGRGGAGIGGGGGNAGGEITINGGTVNATGSKDAKSLSGGAGIGGGGDGAGGTITITGGTVNATGGSSYSVINFGDVGEKPGGPGAGIGGGGNRGAGGTVNISGGSVNANGGIESPLTGGAGIGGGNAGAGGVVNITGGVVSAFGGSFIFAGIGDGDGLTKISGNEGTFSATGNTVVIANKISDISGHTNKTWRGVIFDGAGGAIYEDNHSFTLPGNVTIPPGYSLEMKKEETLTVPPNTTLTVDGHIIQNGGTITGSGIIIHPENILPKGEINISQGDVLIGSSCGANCPGHVITGNNRYTKHSVKVSGGKHKITLYYTDIQPDEPCSAFTISSGAEVELTLVGNNLLFGNGEFAALTVQEGGKLTITKESTGTLNAISYNGGAGIGGDSGYAGGTIIINGGMVKAAGNGGGAGIGGGWHGAGGTITIDGDAVVVATSTGGASIGAGHDRTGATVNRTRGIIFENKAGTFYGDHVQLNSNVALYPGENLTIPSGKTLTIPSYKTLTNHANLSLDSGGTLFLDGGTLVSDGTLTGSGAFKTSLVSGDIADIPDQVYTGKAIEPPVTLKPRNILGRDFTVTTDGFTKSYEHNTGIGTAKVVYTRLGYPTVEKTFHIVKSGTTFEGLATYNGVTPATDFTYGDTITVKAKPKATGTAANGAKFTAPGANQMALFLGTVQLCEPVGPVSGVYTMTYNTTDKGLPPGYNTITAKYVGNDTMADATGDVSVTLLPKALTSATVTSGSRVYDGSRDFVNVLLTLTGVESGDTVTATADGTAASADVGTRAFTASSITLGGTHAKYYTLPLSNVSGSVDIKKKPVTVTVTAQNKVYDGTTTAQVTCAVIGKVGTDDVTATANGTVKFADKNVGDGKTVTATGISLWGTKKDNYELNSAPATTTANITKKPIAWNYAGKVNPKAYDDSTTATVATDPTLIGVESGDNVTVTSGSVAFANANVGTHAITATGFGIEGTDAGNYIVPTGNPPFNNGEIKAKKITPTVTVSDAYTFTGGQIRPAANQIEVKDGTTTVIPATNYTVSYGENINVTTGGSVTVTLKGNYSGTGTGNFDIGKATSTSVVAPEPILMTEKTVKAYSIPLPTGAGNAGTLTYQVDTPSGTNSIFSKEPAISTDKKNLEFTSAAGTVKDQTAAVVITIGSDNYKDFTVTLKFEITKKRSVELTGLTALNSTYDGTGKAGYAGTLLVDNHNVTEDQIKTLIFAYKGINGTNYSSPNAPTNAGSYNLVVSVIGTNIDYTGHHVDIPFTIAPKTLNVTAGDYKVTKPWDGTTAKVTPSGALSVSGILNNEAKVNATPRDYPGSDAGNYAVTVDLALSGTGSGNYVLASSTVEVTGSIAKAESYTGTQAAAPTLVAANEISVRLQTITVEGETVEYAMSTTNAAPGTGWQTSTDFGSLTAATTYYFFARVQENTNHPAGTISGTAITTKQAVHAPVAPKSITITNGAERTGTVTLADVFGANVPADATFGTPVVKADANVMKSFTKTDGSTLSYTSNINSANTSVTDVFTVPITSKGYEEITLTVSFSTSPKASAVISATLNGKKYDGIAMVPPTPSPATLNYTYQWQKDDANITNAPKDVGNYKLVITGENDTSSGSLTLSFIIVKQALTVTATNAQIKVGDAAPTYAFTTSGLVSGETLGGVSVTCGYINNGSASGNAGRYPITVSGGTVSGGNDNYAIDYVPGTLTVTLDTTTLDNAITAANTAKRGITVSDQTPGQVANGTRFVTTAAMETLNAALAGAEASKAGATATGQITDAAAALTQATNTFTAAIQTGTHSGGGGGGGGSNPQPKPEPPKTDPGTGNTEVSVPVKPVTKGDTSSATVPEKAVSDAIAAAEKEAAKTGGSASVTVTVDAPKDAKTVETTLPSKSLSAVAAGKTEGLKISTPVADLSFDSEALKNIAGMAGEDVKISATQVDAKVLTDTQKSQVGDAPVFDFTVTSGDKTISNFNGGAATVSVPYTLKEGENPSFVTVWLLDDTGKLIPIQASYKDGKIAFETGHFSRYAIGYLPFTDVKADWAYESIVYAYQNQLFSGVGDDKFAPTANMNRAMLWTVLYRMAGSPGKTETPANWYADAQAWAMANSISDGTNPTGNITREQLATILWRYAQSKKQDVSIGEDTNILSYDDFDQMSQYAIPALQWACGAGVITGKSDSVLDPRGNATRAQVAAMLQRYATLVK